MTAPAFKSCGCGRSYTAPEWLALASIGRVAWVPVGDDLDAEAYRAAVAGGVL